MIHPEIFRGTLYYWFKKKLNSNRNNHLSLRGWCLLKKLNKMATVFTLYTVRVLHFNPNNFDQYLSPYYVTILYDINIVFKMSCVQFSDERFRIPGLLLSIYGVPAFRSLIWISISKLCHWKDLALGTWYFNSFFPIKIFSHTIYHLQCIWNALRCCDSSSAAMIDPTTERQLCTAHESQKGLNTINCTYVEFYQFTTTVWMILISTFHESPSKSLIRTLTRRTSPSFVQQGYHQDKCNVAMFLLWV